MVPATPHIVMIGSVNFDIIVKAPRLPREGENLPVGGLQNCAGGKGANRAVAAQRLEAKATLIGAVGDDAFGAFLKKELAANKIDLTHLKVDLQNSTGVAFITVFPSGNNAIMVEGGANRSLTPKDVEGARTAIAEADALVLDLEIPLETIAVALKLAKQFKKLSILDAGPVRDCPLEILREVDIVSPNESELEKLSGMPVTDIESAKKAGEFLLHQGVSELVLKLSSKGSLWMKGNFWEHFPAFPVKALDPTAAGDAFTTALAIQLAKKKTIKEACIYGNLAGALSTTKIGAIPSLPTLKEIENFRGLINPVGL